MRERRLGDRELDEHAVAGDDRPRIRRDRDTDPADARGFPSVAPARGVPDGFDRSDELQVGVTLEARDDAGSHPARGAGDDDVRHAGDYFTRPYDSRIARSFC